MKKLITAVLSLSIMSEFVPLVSSARDLYVHNGLPEWSDTAVTGDINNDGNINIADAVILNEYIINGSAKDSEISRMDLNYDCFVDSFDLISIRKLVLNPDSAFSLDYAVDIVKSAENAPDGKVLTSQSAMTEYLSTFIEDEAEIAVFSERYNDKFFEENNLVLQPFIQERGRGIFYTVSGAGLTQNNEICIVISPNYEVYRPLYRVTNTYLLIQVAIPKSQSNESNSVTLIDTEKISYDVSSYTYFSPDDTKEIYITQESFTNLADIRVYLKNSAISFSPLTNITTENGFTPFNDNGEWYKDNDGNDVFGDGIHYSITWLDEKNVIFEYEVSEGIKKSFPLLLEPQTDPDSDR